MRLTTTSKYYNILMIVAVLVCVFAENILFYQETLSYSKHFEDLKHLRQRGGGMRKEHNIKILIYNHAVDIFINHISPHSECQVNRKS